MVSERWQVAQWPRSGLVTSSGFSTYGETRIKPTHVAGESMGIILRLPGRGAVEFFQFVFKLLMFYIFKAIFLIENIILYLSKIIIFINN